MNIQEFQNMVIRYFRGQLTDSEYELLTNKLEDPTFRRYFEHTKLEWNQQPEMDELGKRNWKRFQYKINKTDSSKVKYPITRKLWFQVAAVAAILFLGLLGGGTLMYFFSGNKINQEQLVFETPRGEKSMVKLPDGSQVWLNANSRLVYHSFSSKHRQVELKGEAFFNVAHNANAPFVVKTNECEVKVLGTSFNVMAYDEFGRKEITLLSGKVNVLMEGNEQVLKPGQALILKDHKIQIIEANTSQASGWVDNKFNFQNIPLSELMKRLENWYDVDITLENPSGREVNYTGTFKNEETIWQVLDAIAVYTPIQYQKSDLRQIKIMVK
jgi:ferric-dicitrate binding protein FerR (iron transport regulator)